MRALLGLLRCLGVRRQTSGLGCGLLHGAFHMQVGVVRRGEDLQALGCGIAVEADHERLRCVQLLERLQDALGDLLA